MNRFLLCFALITGGIFPLPGQTSWLQVSVGSKLNMRWQKMTILENATRKVPQSNYFYVRPTFYALTLSADIFNRFRFSFDHRKQGVPYLLNIGTPKSKDIYVENSQDYLVLRRYYAQYILNLGKKWRLFPGIGYISGKSKYYDGIPFVFGDIASYDKNGKLIAYIHFDDVWRRDLGIHPHYDFWELQLGVEFRPMPWLGLEASSGYVFDGKKDLIFMRGYYFFYEVPKTNYLTTAKGAEIPLSIAIRIYPFLFKKKWKTWEGFGAKHKKA
jgi:hypothetical protein